jgi:hypothetical protein
MYFLFYLVHPLMLQKLCRHNKSVQSHNTAILFQSMSLQHVSGIIRQLTYTSNYRDITSTNNDRYSDKIIV